MPPPSSRVKGLADSLRAVLAQRGVLTRDQARLYSHAVRHSWGASGLSTWTVDEAGRLLVDAMRLVEAAYVEFAASDPASARDCYKKAGEILEWLFRSGSHNSEGFSLPIPLPLLAACCYQLADCPAMASMLAEQAVRASTLSTLFGSFLQGRFDKVLSHAAAFWSQHPQFTSVRGSGMAHDELESEDDHPFLTVELVRCIGAISHAISVDQTTRLDLCLRKLRGLAHFASRTTDSHTCLLVNLIADIGSRFAGISVHRGIDRLGNTLSDVGLRSARMFARELFQNGRGLMWSTQQLGLQKLAEQRSVAVCTPTGSGKTAIAEFALLQGLHPREAAESAGSVPPLAPLAIYLVPSRALAAEVEARLAADFQSLPSGVLVTGLYGGTEWSIADAWLTSDQPTILVATVEKTDALLRFLGPFVYPRLRLVVLDEAHHVDLGDDQHAIRQLMHGNSRQCRLEQLLARMLGGSPQSRCIALSAVAGGTKRALAQWISEGRDDEPIGTDQRSMRQVIGVLECFASQAPEIQVHAVDGRRLELSGRADAPYIPMGIPAMPAVPPMFRNSFTAFLQAQCLWTAMHLAAGNRSVLISIMQGIDTVTGRFVEMLTRPKRWVGQTPAFFDLPQGGERELFDACTQACRDYCGVEAFETTLLSLGIAVHHGQLPVRVRRLMTEVIRHRITPIALATSTLTEGVNLPFDVILVPDILRTAETGQGLRAATVPPAEFRNLAGRAGRPGSNIEGMTLIANVSQPIATGTKRKSEQRRELPARSSRLTTLLGQIVATDDEVSSAKSGIAELLRRIEALHRRIQPSANAEDFENWLTRCIPEASPADADPSAHQAVDLLDQHVLALLFEAEQRLANDAPWADIERQLQIAWAHTYARYASAESDRLERLITRRGQTLRDTVYPSAAERRKLYRMGLPPKRAAAFFDQAALLEAHLATGGPYATWTPVERFAYIERAIAMVQEHDAFRMTNGANWREVLSWWLGVSGSTAPSPGDLRDWLRLVSDGFEYRFTSAVTATIGIALDRHAGSDLIIPTIDEWRQQTGLPWSAFWLRELIAWGTLDPVAAFLLSQDRNLSRQAAESQAGDFYAVTRETDATERLDPRTIRQWTNARATRPFLSPAESMTPVRLLRDFPPQARGPFPVVPSIQADRIQWIDSAGYALAESHVPAWFLLGANILDYVLEPDARRVRRTSVTS